MSDTAATAFQQTSAPMKAFAFCHRRPNLAAKVFNQLSGPPYSLINSGKELVNKPEADLPMDIPWGWTVRDSTEDRPLRGLRWQPALVPGELTETSCVRGELERVEQFLTSDK
ncbi:hypothetical protein BaRGS_00025870, partial [Batillaria attramentaria]